MLVLLITALHLSSLYCCHSFTLNVLARNHQSKLHPTQLSSSNVGKGDDTIKVLNQLETVVIDATLTSDPAFWDYCLVTREQQGNHMYVLDTEGRTNSDSIASAEDSLCRGGALKEDVRWYQDEYDMFETQAISSRDTPPSPFKKSGFVVSTSVLLELIADDKNKQKECSILDQYFRIIEVRDDSSFDDGDTEINEEKSYMPDISVKALGELRALTICSFALLNKRQ